MRRIGGKTQRNITVFELKKEREREKSTLQREGRQCKTEQVRLKRRREMMETSHTFADRGLLQRRSRDQGEGSRPNVSHRWWCFSCCCWPQPSF
jgi:hypothetical protein